MKTMDMGLVLNVDKPTLTAIENLAAFAATFEACEHESLARHEAGQGTVEWPRPLDEYITHWHNKDHYAAFRKIAVVLNMAATELKKDLEIDLQELLDDVNVNGLAPVGI